MSGADRAPLPSDRRSADPGRGGDVGKRRALVRTYREGLTPGAAKGLTLPWRVALQSRTTLETGP